MVTAQRLAASQVGEGEWPVPEIAPGIHDLTAEEVKARRLVLRNALNEGENAGHETGIMKCDAKRRKLVPE